MTEQKPRNPIIKRVKITVESSDTNQYGDLIVHSKEGQEYKVSNKREHLFDVFQRDAEVVVGFASYMNKEYVAEATAAEQVVTTDTSVQKEKPPQLNPALAKNKADSRGDSIEKQVSLKASVELSSAGIIKPEQTLSYAEVYYRWLKGDIEVKDETVFKALIEKHFKNKGEAH